MRYLGDVVPPEQGVGPALPQWTFSDSFWFALENMPIIGPIFKAPQAPQNTATAKAAGLIVEKTGIPNPSTEDIEVFLKEAASTASAVGTVIGYIAVAAGLYYGYKIVKEIKS